MLSVFLLFSRLAPKIVAGIVKENKQLGLTVLIQRAEQQEVSLSLSLECLTLDK